MLARRLFGHNAGESLLSGNNTLKQLQQFQFKQAVNWLFVLLVSIVIFLSSSLFQALPAYAQSSPSLQVISGQVAEGRPLAFELPNLQAGAILQVNAKRLDGNLDPFIGILAGDLDIDSLVIQLEAELELAMEEGGDPLEAMSRLADKEFLAWNDDGGSGYGSDLTFAVPQSGSYQLFAIGSPFTNSSGTVQLTLGLNNSEPLSDLLERAERESKDVGSLSYGDSILLSREILAEQTSRVEEISGRLSEDKTSTFFLLNRLQQGQTLYAYVESTDGNLKPILSLRDYGDKILRSANHFGKSTSGQLSYEVDDTDGLNFQLEVNRGEIADLETAGEFRLLVGIDEPDVLSGAAEATGDSILLKPIQVDIGLKIHQITEIDQQAENFGIVASLKLEWNDPALAFSPDTCQCRFKEYTIEQFSNLLEQNNRIWPSFTLYNQQGRRFIQNQAFILYPSGDVQYFERFSVTLQAPDFYFRSFPFDTQKFFVKITSLYPDEFFQFRALEGFSGLGDRLGEEEWVPTSFSTSVSSVLSGTTELVSSEFSSTIVAHRHLNFYVLRIFIPIGIIIFVSWLPGFLGDFSKRIDIANGTLLLFIAFNFTISNDLPRLGYLTFLDILLLCTFILTALTLIYNVILKRLESVGKGMLVNQIDNITIWLIPMIYFLSYATIAIIFL